MEKGGLSIYTISNSPAHTCNQHHTPPIPKPNHLSRNRLRRHKNPRHINAHHVIRILCAVLEGRRLLLDTRRGDETVHAAVLVCYFGHDGV